MRVRSLVVSFAKLLLIRLSEDASNALEHIGMRNDIFLMRIAIA